MSAETIIALNRKRIPTVKDGDEAAVAYMKFHFNDRSRYRIASLTRMSRNLWRKLGRHWCEADPRLAPAASGYRFQTTRPRGWAKNRPKPVDNLIGDGIKNLVSRLTRKEYDPACGASTQDPVLQAAARMNESVMAYDAKQAKFKESIEDVCLDNICTYGWAGAMSLFDEPYDVLTPTAATGAVMCVTCGGVLSSKQVDPRRVGLGSLFGLDKAKELEGGEMELGVCPRCDPAGAQDAEGFGQLQPHLPSLEDAMSGEDLFGRPLGSMVPTGKAIWRALSPHEVYPENGGMVNTDQCRVWGYAHVESMEWLEAHVEDEALLRTIEPESPGELAKHHPTLGDPWFNSTSTRSDENVFANHVRVFDLVVEPMEVGGDAPEDGLRWGRRLMMVRDKICGNGPLLREVPDVGCKIPLVKFAAAVAERIDGEFWGKSPVDDAVPLNDRLNRLDAQMEDIRERGVPFVAVPVGIEFDARDDQITGSMRVYEYDNTAAPTWDPKSAIVNSTPITGNTYMPEREKLVQSIKERIGPMPVETGAAGGANSAIQLQQQAEEAAAKLGPLDKARVTIVEAMFQHHRDVIWAFRRETGEFERKTAAGKFEKESYTGTDLLEDVKVTLEAKGSTDQGLLKQQKAQQAHDMGLYGPPGQLEPSVADDVLEFLDMPKPKDVRSIQLQRADASWAAFVRAQEVPYVDTTICDTWIWYQRLGKHWQSDDAIDMQRAAGWDDVLKKLSGWEKKLAQATMQDEAQRAVYEGHPPEEWGAIYQEYSEKAADVNKSAAQVAQASAEVGAVSPPSPPVPPPPQPPASGQFLPDALCERLLMLWRSMLGLPDPSSPQVQPLASVASDPTLGGAVIGDQAAQIQTLQRAQQLDPLLRMYAVIQECRLDAKGKQQASAAGAMTPAAPGGSSTPAGSVPTAGAPVQAAAGVAEATGGAA